MDILLRPWRLYANFDGRSRRSEFFLFIVVRYGLLVLIMMVFGGVTQFQTHVQNGQASPASVMSIIVLVVAFLASVVPGWSVTVRRLHDQGKSFKWLFLTFVPYIGLVATLVFGLWPGDAFENDYGVDPRQGDLIEADVIGTVFE